MKPVAWIASDGESFSYAEPPSKNYLGMAWWKPVYLACPATKLRAVTPETTTGEMIRWAPAGNVLGRGEYMPNAEETSHDF